MIYIYGKETTKPNGQTTFTTNDNWKADTDGVTHHRAKCSVCGLYLDNDYVKHSYTEYVNDKETTGLTDNNKFVALCECGVKATVTENTAKNLRQALLDAKTNGIPVVHITAPYWQDGNKNGFHTDLLADTSSGTGAIKVPAGVTTVFSILRNGDCPHFPK